MSAPIYADPVLNGAADPAVIRKQGTNQWWMFYTVRRANHVGEGHEWIHGTPIGVAVSTDNGRSWHYHGTVAGLDTPGDTGLNTHWAPEVIWAEGEYHMYLSYITGVAQTWDVPRTIVHFTSPDLLNWTRIGPLKLSSERVIDAGVIQCPDGLYRLWYKDESHGSASYVAVSKNLCDWTVEDVSIPGLPDGLPHEGPNVFVLGGWYWMIVDEWHGQGVFRSTDAINWTRQGVILAEPGSDPMDTRYARHADVVAFDNHAALFYFTHPTWNEREQALTMSMSDRVTTIHVARLHVENDTLICQRNVDYVELA